MHLVFDPTISLGNLLTLVITLTAVFAALTRIDRQLAKFLIEHEILIGEYCKLHGIKAHDLPTRAGK